MTLSKSKSISHSSSSNGHVTQQQQQQQQQQYHQTSSSGNTAIVAASYQECADCGSKNAQWASLNHGVIVCDQCCLAHRNLGRCISVIKSLRKSYWPQSLIDTLYELVRSNANHIWEATLHDSSSGSGSGKSKSSVSVKKPTPKDSNITRLNYIRMKYENLSFIARNGKYTSKDELNQQLMASVRTNNYEQTLRILAQGADANYRSSSSISDDCAGNQCLHTAVLSNQIGQVELLCLYSGDIGGLNAHGQTPLDLATRCGNDAMATRLRQLQYELTDEFAYFLCNKRADHRSGGKHLLVPSLNEIPSYSEEMSRNAKLKLKELPDHLFEELCKDLYDELDRRQVESIWKSTVGVQLINEPIPFLIIKSCFSQTRNQLRQKLARFNHNEFSGLLAEVLIEFQRRHELLDPQTHSLLKKGGGGGGGSSSSDKASSVEHNTGNGNETDEIDEDPLYDKVPSDEDYASVAESESESIYDRPPTATTTTTNTAASSMKSHHHHHHHQLPASLSSGVGKRPPPQQQQQNTASSSRTAASGGAGSASLVANAESALNSMIDGLNQMTYSAVASVSRLNQSAGSDSMTPPPLPPPTIKSPPLTAPPPPQSNNNNNNSSYNSNNDSLVLDKVNAANYNELKSENDLMQSMINRLMEENAQLRAEKMLLAATGYAYGLDDKDGADDCAGNHLLDIHHEYNAATGQQPIVSPTTSAAEAAIAIATANYQSYLNTSDEMALYSTIKNTTTTANNNGNSTNAFTKTTATQFAHTLLSSPRSATTDNFYNMIVDAATGDIGQHVHDQFDIYRGYEVDDFGGDDQQKTTTQEQHQQQQQQHITENAVADHVSKSLLMSPQGNQNDGATTTTTPTATETQQQQQQQQAAANSVAESGMPSKESVIVKMKLVTRAVQELFKATKESDFASFKDLCEKVNQAVTEMIGLFPGHHSRYSSTSDKSTSASAMASPINESLVRLEATSANLVELINNYQHKLCCADASGADSIAAEQQQQAKVDQINETNNMSVSTSSSSALSSAYGGVAVGAGVANVESAQPATAAANSQELKNIIVSDLVNYSYEIAHTVKQIIVIMGAEQ